MFYNRSKQEQTNQRDTNWLDYLDLERWIFVFHLNVHFETDTVELWQGS